MRCGGAPPSLDRCQRSDLVASQPLSLPLQTPEPHSLNKPCCPPASIPTDALIRASSDWGPQSPGSLTGKEEPGECKQWQWVAGILGGLSPSWRRAICPEREHPVALARPAALASGNSSWLRPDAVVSADNH
ncbi:hypothetical protein JOQ06_020055 [Pogonophryne albipinna]|uniref:Uncharacterized protein n=1 Tax=Pogonophryne albipinna TaxID=1090488 RepID=A0AAD6BQV4_9TELE|nr:hypothetical protein JOQ06_020055 [Pogonophryne albipinna]